MFYMFLQNKIYCVQWEKKVVVFYPDIIIWVEDNYILDLQWQYRETVVFLCKVIIPAHA